MVASSSGAVVVLLLVHREAAIALRLMAAALAIGIVMAVGMHCRELRRIARQRNSPVVDPALQYLELQHRVENTLGFMAGLLWQEQRRLAHDAEAAAAFAVLRRRFELLARIHRRMRELPGTSGPFARHLESICRDLIDASRPGEVRLRVRAPRVVFAARQTESLLLIATEAVANALKHAFVDRSHGRIDIQLQATGVDAWMLRVDDDGPGPSPGRRPDGDGAHGGDIMRALARDLPGSLSIEPLSAARGTRVSVAFTARGCEASRRRCRVPEIERAGALSALSTSSPRMRGSS